MNDTGEVMNGERRALLERRAEAVRARLERRLDALDERRDHLVELAKRVARPPVSVVLLGAATAVGAAVVIHQIRKKRPSRSQRLGAAMLGVPARKPDSFLVKAFKRAALSFVATLVQRVSTRGLDHLLPETQRAELPEAPQPPAY
jgi:hypothetical protein